MTDLEAAKSLHSHDPHLDKQIGYSASQCAEKLLKSLILIEGKPNERTHNIATLHGKLGQCEIDDLIEELYDLTDYSIMGRYGEIEDEDLDMDFVECFKNLDELAAYCNFKIQNM